MKNSPPQLVSRAPQTPPNPPRAPSAANPRASASTIGLLKLHFELSIHNYELHRNIKNRKPWKIRTSPGCDELTSCLSFTSLYCIHIYFQAVWRQSKELPDAVCCSPKRTADYIIITGCKSELTLIYHKSLCRVPFCGWRFLNMILWVFSISANIFFCFPQLVSLATAHAARTAEGRLSLLLACAAPLAAGTCGCRFPAPAGSRRQAASVPRSAGCRYARRRRDVRHTQAWHKSKWRYLTSVPPQKETVFPGSNEHFHLIYRQQPPEQAKFLCSDHNTWKVK